MNPATHGMEGSAAAPVLYMALELSNESWRLVFGDGTKRRQGSVPAADLAKLAEAVAKAKERFKLPASARALSCYEAGRDGFWLHRALEKRRHRERGDRCRFDRGEPRAAPREDRPARRRALALEAQTPSHRRARRLEPGACAERGGRGREAPAPGASSA